MAQYKVDEDDDRMKSCMELFHLTKADVMKLHVPFRKHDKQADLSITVDDFYKMIKEVRWMFGDALFELCDVEETDKLSFSEFVQSVCTYCFFEEVEVLRFCFFILDKDKNGAVDRDELQFFLKALWLGESNVDSTLDFDKLDKNSNGKLEFKEFQKMHELFPKVLYPAFKLQQSIMDAVVGESWWLRKKAALAFKKESKASAAAKQEAAIARRFEANRQAQIRSEMGFVSYYLFSAKRKEYDEKYPPAGAPVDDDGPTTAQQRGEAQAKHLATAEQQIANPYGGGGSGSGGGGDGVPATSAKINPA